MTISDEDIKGITNAAMLDQAINQCLEVLKLVHESERDCNRMQASIEVKKIEILSILGRLQGLRIAMKVQTGQ